MHTDRERGEILRNSSKATVAGSVAIVGTGGKLMQIRFKKLHPTAVMPKRATDGAAGFDLTAVSQTWKDGGKVHYTPGIAFFMQEVE